MADTAFNDPAESAGFDMSDAYRKASELKPVKAKDLRAVYKPYGIKLGGVKGKSDRSLYKLATKEVIDWFNQKKNQPKLKRRASGGGGRAARPRGSGGQTPQRSSGAAGTRRTGSGGLPDTAMPAPGSGSRVTSATKLPDIPDPVRTRVNRYTGKMVDPRMLG